MNIEGVIWTRYVVEKLAVKHQVETFEVEEMLAATPKFRFAEKGEREGEDVYLALGQAQSGRYLVAYFIYKKTKEALILSARDMADKERKWYGRK
ncbi:MAG: BrnT family toxin [Acidobacteriota bacterium]|nr:BrnT family toxin [Acidobacteriota bacterium]